MTGSTCTKSQLHRSRFWTVDQTARFTFADRTNEEINDGTPTTEASLYADLLNAALQRSQLVQDRRALAATYAYQSKSIGLK